ncbi:hypothetical protein [Prevotella sp.]|uniref:hypothetical protein n=1 Tax=Prevotella sp. TaxID=59823 RepID=UPI002F93F8D0
MRSRMILLVVGIGLMLVACGTNRVGKPVEKLPNDSLTEVLEATETSVLGRDSVWRMRPETIDTVIGDWHIRLRRQANSYVIGRGTDYQVADNSVFLTLERRGKTIWKQREIGTKDVIGELGVYQLMYAHPFYATPTTLYLNVVACMPETDDLWNMLYCVTPGRAPDLYAMDHEMGAEAEDFVNLLSEFFHLYFHQKQVMRPTTAQMRELFDRYCANPLRSQLEADDAHADNQWLLQGEKIDFEQALRTIDITCDSLGAGVMVRFIPRQQSADTLVWRVFGTPDGERITRVVAVKTFEKP